MCVSKHLIQEVHGYGFQPKTYPDAEKKTYKLIKKNVLSEGLLNCTGTMTDILLMNTDVHFTRPISSFLINTLNFIYSFYL